MRSRPTIEMQDTFKTFVRENVKEPTTLKQVTKLMKAAQLYPSSKLLTSILKSQDLWLDGRSHKEYKPPNNWLVEDLMKCLTIKDTLNERNIMRNMLSLDPTADDIRSEIHEANRRKKTLIEEAEPHLIAKLISLRDKGYKINRATQFIIESLKEICPVIDAVSTRKLLKKLYQNS